MTTHRVPEELRRSIAERDADRQGLTGAEREDFIRDQVDPEAAVRRARERHQAEAAEAAVELNRFGGAA